MNLPRYGVATLNRLNYVRFELDHDNLTARAISSGPHEAAHSSMNGAWVHSQIEPWKEAHRLGDLKGLTLRLQGPPFNGVVYEVVESCVPVAEVPVMRGA